VLKVLEKYYDPIWRSFPQDPHVIHERCTIGSKFSKPLPPDHQAGLDYRVRNKLILNQLITKFVLSRGTCPPSALCIVLNQIIGNSNNDLTRNLEKGKCIVLI